MSGDSWPNYVRLEWEADDEEIHCPPTTHLIATVDDLTDVLDSLRSLSLSGDPWPNYVGLEWEAGDEEIHSPPATHLIAIVDDLTDMLDFDSEDIDGMDDDAGEEQEPPPTGHWTA